MLPECTRLDEHSYSLDVPTHLPTLYYANVESEAAVVQSARLFDGSTMPFEAVKDIQPNYYVPVFQICFSFAIIVSKRLDLGIKTLAVTTPSRRGGIAVSGKCEESDQFH